MVTTVEELEVDERGLEKKLWSVDDAKGVEDELIVVVGVKSVVGGDELICLKPGPGAVASTWDYKVLPSPVKSALQGNNESTSE